MKILLVCSSGMSTSLLVNKMKEASDNQDEIWAVGQSELPNEIDKCDVILIGPQLRMAKRKIDAMIEGKGIPCDIIPAVMYGRVDGKGVLDFAHDMVK